MKEEYEKMLKSNEYFDGKVKSIALETSDGPATVGVMEKGEYTFSTSTVEIMVVTEGALDIKLPGESDFKTYKKGEQFRIEAGKSFDVVTKTDSAYLCYYK